MRGSPRWLKVSRSRSRKRRRPLEGPNFRSDRGRSRHARSHLARPSGRTGGHGSRPGDPGADRRHHRGHVQRHLRLGPPPDRGHGAVHDGRRRHGSRADGDRRGGRLRGHRGEGRRPRRRPVQHLVQHLLDVLAGACSPSARRRRTASQGYGASLFGYTKLYGQVPGGQAEYLRVPFGNTLPIKVPDAPADDRFVYLSDVLPTAWQAVQYAGIPPGGSVLVLGLGPIGDMAARIALHLGAGQVVGADVVPERLARARAWSHGDRLDRAGRRRLGRSGPHRRPRPGRRHRRRRHGGARLAARLARAEGHRRRAGRGHGEGHAGGRRRPAGGAQHRRSRRSAAAAPSPCRASTAAPPTRCP